MATGLSILVAFSALLCVAQNPAQISLTASPASATFGQQVTLNAAVSGIQTGRLTFYDGTGILGTAPLNNGKATLVTTQIAAGKRSLRAILVNNESAGLSSAIVPYTVTAIGGYGFVQGPGSPKPVNLIPWSVALTDFDRDGFLDLVIANAGANKISVLSGDGTGVFKSLPGGTFSVGVYPIAAVSADLDGDGAPDLVIANYEAGTVQIILSSTIYLTGLPQNTIAVGTNPLSVAIADFNADGNPDLAVANQGDGTVSILLGTGGGGFREASGSPWHVGLQPFSVAVGDFDKDGNVDIVAANIGDNTVSVLLGDGKGGFRNSPSSPLTAVVSPHSVAVGDFDNDGNSDLAIANEALNTVTIFLGGGDGTFRPATSFSAPAPWALAVGDFDGDGNTDLASVDFVDNLLSVWTGDGHGSFQNKNNFNSGGSGPIQLAVADFNGDGRADIAIANQASNEVSVFLAVPAVTVSVTQGSPVTIGADAAFVLDVANSGTAPKDGGATVIATFPPGLVPVPSEASGNGWTCLVQGQVVTCNRNDVLSKSYPSISVKATVNPSACPSVSIGAAVTTVQGKYATSFLTRSSHCILVSQKGSDPFLVGTKQDFTLFVSAQNPADTALGVTLTDILPPGMVFVSAIGPFWNCSRAGQVVNCSLPPLPSDLSQIPPITLTVILTSVGCPSAVSFVTTQLNGALPDTSTFSVPLSGCLSITPQTVVFLPTQLGATTNQSLLTVTSTDSSPLSVSVDSTGSASFGVGHNCHTLNPGGSCFIAVNFLNPCLGSQVGTVSVSAQVSVPQGSVVVPYPPISILGTGIPQQSFFTLADGTVLKDGSTIQPGQQQTVLYQFTPPQKAGCAQPAIAMTFTPLIIYNPPLPAGTLFDESLAPDTGVLNPGTVYGTILLKAVTRGQDNVTQVSPDIGSVSLTVPKVPGVIQNVTITGKTDSTFDLIVAGYSTPRDTGPMANTQVCISLSAAGGANLGGAQQSCPGGLAQDIEIWYAQPVSYASGSAFSATLTVSFSGDAKAIGQIKTIIRNEAGDSSPYCLNFGSGTEQSCK